MKGLQDGSSKLTEIGFNYFLSYSRKKEDLFLRCVKIAHKALFKEWGETFHFR